MAGAAAAQTGPRIIDTNRLDTVRPPAPPATVPVAQPNSGRTPDAAAPAEDREITLRSVRVEGAVSLPPSAIEAASIGQRGRTVKVRDIYGIADRIGAAYAARGYALYQVNVPGQDFSNGNAVIRVTEGYVDTVAIDGDTKDADLSLLQAYAARIASEKPLRQRTLERYVLLMNDIAGLQVGSRFEPVPGRPGAVHLVLSIARKRFEYGIGVSNQGQALLSRTSFDVNVAANSVLREGDRTQLVFGAPVSLGRYQFYGGVHRQPIGTDGATLQLSAGYLVTQPGGLIVSGNAFTTSLKLSYPIVRAIKESLIASVSLDALNADNAVLGSTLSDERTRAVRGSLVYALQDEWDGISTAALTISGGLDGLGARRGSAASGGPSFTKASLYVSREQGLPWRFVARLSAAGQYAPSHLPLSEQFAYGGSLFGRSFDAGAVLGDQGIETSAELAWRFPDSWAVPHTSGTEVYGFADYGRVWTTHTLYQYSTDHGASAGFGARTKLEGKVTLDLTLAKTLHKPLQVTTGDGWRFVLGVRGQF